MLHYHISGKGPVLVFLHGFLEDHTMWYNLINKLEEDYTCIAVDLPGHGESEDCEDEDNILSLADKVREMLVNENITRFKVIGHSMGGYVALELAGIGDHVCLVNSHADSDPEEKKDNRSRSIPVIRERYKYFVKETIPSLFQDPDHYKQEIQDIIQIAHLNDPENMVRITKAMRDRSSLIEKMNDLACYIWFVASKNDPIVPADMIRMQAKALNNSKLCWIEECGHMAHIEAPEKLELYVREFAELS